MLLALFSNGYRAPGPDLSFTCSNELPAFCLIYRFKDSVRLRITARHRRRMLRRVLRRVSVNGLQANKMNETIAALT
ncbi:MAG: hypothetical protein ACI83P_000825 [Janthinobacterium sp.]|jgi:hypothetical protein